VEHAADDARRAYDPAGHVLDLLGRERLLVLDARVRRDDLEVRVPARRRRRRPQAAVALVAELQAVILGQATVELDAVGLEREFLVAPGRDVAAAPAADEAAARMRRRLRQAVALEDQHVVEPAFEQVQRRGAPEDATADDDHFGSLGEAHADLAWTDATRVCGH
jgi:hypothetical protein